jgi:hypothetical protein
MGPKESVEEQFRRWDDDRFAVVGPTYPTKASGPLVNS